MSTENKYRRLEMGEIIQEGDEYDACSDPWRDDPVWVPATCIGKPAPDPNYVSHRQYRRKVQEPLCNLTDDQCIKLVNFAYGPTEDEEDIPDNVEIRTGTCGHQFRVVKTKVQEKCFFCLLKYTPPKQETKP